MQIVIDIDDNLYTRLFDNGVDNYDDASDMAKAIRKGTPLPKGYGRLIGADALASEIKDLKKSPWYKDNTNLAYLPRKEAVEIIEEIVIGNAPTIIEEDKEGEQEETSS